MKTLVVNLPLAGNLQQAIDDLSVGQYAAGRRLVTCFVVGSDLVLIFQASQPV